MSLNNLKPRIQPGWTTKERIIMRKEKWQSKMGDRIPMQLAILLISGLFISPQAGANALTGLSSPVGTGVTLMTNGLIGFNYTQLQSSTDSNGNFFQSLSNAQSEVISDGNGGFLAGISSARVSANLATGQLKGFSSSNQINNQGANNLAWTFAEMQDNLVFSVPNTAFDLNGTAKIPVSVLFEGNISTPSNGSWGKATYSLSLPFGTLSIDNNAQRDASGLLISSGNNINTNTLLGDLSTDATHVYGNIYLSRGLGLSNGDFVDYSGQFYSFLQTVAGGATVDYGNTAGVTFDFSQGIRMSSESQVFLTAPVPEPGSYAMLLSGLGLMGFIVRRRRGGA